MISNAVDVIENLGITWYDIEETEFTITTSEQLYELAKLSDFCTFERQIFKLEADIIVNEGKAVEWSQKPPEKRWIPISNFAGTFDGQGHSISGIYGKAAFSPLAMFTDTNPKCTIRNLKLINTYFENHGLVGTGSFSSGGGGTFLNLYSNAIIHCAGETCGGIIGSVRTKTKIGYCKFDGRIRQSGRRMGGIVAEIFDTYAELVHCSFTGDIGTEDSIANQNDGVYVGGIFGRANKGARVQLSDSIVAGKIITEDNPKYSASVIGRVFDDAQVVINHVYDAISSREEKSIGRGDIEGEIIKIQRKEWWKYEK